MGLLQKRGEAVPALAVSRLQPVVRAVERPAQVVEIHHHHYRDDAAPGRGGIESRLPSRITASPGKASSRGFYNAMGLTLVGERTTFDVQTDGLASVPSRS